MVEHVACFVRKRDTMSARMLKNVAAGMLPGENAQRRRIGIVCSAGMRGTQKRTKRRGERNPGKKDIPAEKKRGGRCNAGRTWLASRADDARRKDTGQSGTKDDMA
jgi:hypothetical protein